MNRYLALIIAVLSGAEMQAFQLAPRLVVNITIDQLRTDYLEAFTPLYTADGFRKLLSQGVTYEAASYPYEPVGHRHHHHGNHSLLSRHPRYPMARP